MKHIVFYSGGLGSWATVNRVIEQHGKENIILLFTDTMIEDEDLYRFLDETEKDFNIPVTRIAEGRDIWQVFKDERFIGNSRVAPCSHILKQKESLKWLKANYKPDECILYLGIDWTEEHRRAAPTKNWLPYTVKFPMCDEPYVNKVDVVKDLEERGIELPRLYKKGFSHNNCGGFCVKAGQGHFINLLTEIPERYKYHEEKEEEMRQYLKRTDVSILKRQRKGIKYNLTLKQLREEHEAGSKNIDMLDIGGCGCFVSEVLS